MATKGQVNGIDFNTDRKMVELIYNAFFEERPNITIAEFKDELRHYKLYSINDNNNRSFLKSEYSYDNLREDQKRKFYSPQPLLIEGNYYYLKTETGEPETSEHIRFARDHGINIVIYNTSSTIRTYRKFGYNIIDVDSSPLLNKLREDLFNKNDNIKWLMNTLDDSRLLLNAFLDEGLITKEKISTPNYIYFSVDCPTETYYRVTLEKIEHTILDIIATIKNDPYIPDEIKGRLIEFFEHILHYLLVGEYDLENIESAIEEIKKELDIYKRNISPSILDKITRSVNSFSPRGKTYNILGLYVESEQCIILFLNNILNKRNGNTIFNDADFYQSGKIKCEIESVYAHEMFHFAQFGGECVFPNNDYGDKVVVEGLARYFEIKYKANFFNVNETLEFNNLKKDSVVYNPYVGACYVGRSSINTLGAIIDASQFTYKHYGLHLLLCGTEELEDLIKKK